MSDHQFKPEQPVLVEAEFDFYSPEEGLAWVYFPKADNAGEPSGERVPISTIHPAPREGEYRVTKAELYDLARHVDRVAGDACGDAFGTACEDAVNSWLANRKEEA